MKKKRTFCKPICTMQKLVELQCLVDDLADCLELSMLINASLSSIYFMKWIGDSDMKI